MTLMVFAIRWSRHRTAADSLPCYASRHPGDV